MSRNRKFALLGVALVLLAGGAVWIVAANNAAALPQDQRAKLMKTFQDGNFKDAYDGLRKLALDPNSDPKKVSQDLTTGIQCLQNLGRVEEIDEFREGTIKAHAKNWQLLTKKKGSGVFVFRVNQILPTPFILSVCWAWSGRIRQRLNSSEP